MSSLITITITNTIAIQYSTIKYNAIHTIQIARNCNIIQLQLHHNTIPYNTIKQLYYAVQRNTIQYNATPYKITQEYTMH